MTVSLLDCLAETDDSNDYLILTHPTAPALPVRRPERFQCAATSIHPISLTQNWRLPRWLRDNRVDVVFHTHPLSLVLWQPIPTVAAILDVLPIHFPYQFPRGVALYYRSVVRWAAAAATSILTISEQTRKDVVHYLGIQTDKIEVVYLAAASHLRPQPDDSRRRASLARYGLARPYVLYHGNARPHKNLIGLLRAFKRVVEQVGPSYELVLTGREVPGERERNFSAVRQESARLGIESLVRFTGYVADEDLAAVYSGARAFVLPSFYEGFGLPVLEAMACGTPVICSNTSSLPEVAGDAAVLVDPAEPEAIADGLLRVLADPTLHQELSRRGIEQAGRFSWMTAAQQLLQLFQRVNAL